MCTFASIMCRIPSVDKTLDLRSEPVTCTETRGAFSLGPIVVTSD